jgi:hypothetical protein
MFFLTVFFYVFSFTVQEKSSTSFRKGLAPRRKIPLYPEEFNILVI